ncbi:hypothetical protein [Labrys sp. 22185]|uniref:hypothetical protein n=1 Tax=Labrys sp. 22185 TaxID=3453888 RepID=UPI003F8399D3
MRALYFDVCSMKRIISIIFLVILSGCSGDSQKGDVDTYLGMFIWRNAANGKDIAAAFLNDSITLQVATDPHNLDVSSQRNQLEHIAAVAGIRIHNISTPMEILNLYIINRSNIIELMSDINFQKIMNEYYIPAFHHNEINKFAKKAISNSSPCVTVSFPTPDRSTVISYVIINNFRDECEINNLYYAFGIVSRGNHVQDDVALCILYEARRRNLRVKEDISRAIPNIEPACRKKWDRSDH